jgi:hypothetical protein
MKFKGGFCEVRSRRAANLLQAGLEKEELLKERRWHCHTGGPRSLKVEISASCMSLEEEGGGKAEEIRRRLANCK